MIRDIFKKFVTYGIGNLLQTGLNLILLPLYLRCFSPAEYGVISVLSVVISLLTLLSSAGVVNGLTRLFYENEGAVKSRLVCSSYVWYFFMAVVGGTIIYTQGHVLSRLLFKTDLQIYPIRMIGLIFFFTMVRTIPFYLLRLEKRALQFVGFSLLGFFLDFSFKLYFIVYLKRGIPGYFESTAIATVITFFGMFPIVRQHLNVFPDKVFLIKLLRLGVPYIFSGLAVWSLDVSDRLLLNHFSSESAVGVYSLAYTFANIFVIFLTTPVSLFMDPFFFGFAAEHPLPQTKELLQKMMIYFFLAGGILYLLIGLAGPEILRILVKPGGNAVGYLKAGELIPVLTWAPFLYFLTIPMTLSGLLIKKTEINSYVCFITAALNIVLNLFLIPRLGAWGAAISTFIAFFMLIIILDKWVNVLFDVGYPWLRVLKGLGYMGIAFALSWPLNFHSPWLSLMAKVIVGIGSFLALSWSGRGFLSPSEKINLMHLAEGIFSFIFRKRYV
ncbi:MAG: polysaccharide biosynthesis C-terminal domain-containing protein [Candidatus Omnitrophica bacterium]|nr:polysaccharide biosynthesis C-terminal domain-containing protein [Candidatus Omnitrophota bacterium]